VRCFRGLLKSRVCFNESDDKSEAFVFKANPVCILMCTGSGDFILLVEGQEYYSFYRKRQRMCSDPQVLLCIYCSVMFTCEWLPVACQSNILLPSSANKDVK